MSIIVAYSSNFNGVVASDGREFDDVIFKNGAAIKPAQVKSEEFDKTFSIDDGRIIGAHCGLLSFSGSTVAEHIKQIVRNMPQSGVEFRLIVEQIEIEIKTMLSQIDEVSFSFRKIDLLLVAGMHLTKKRHNIASIRFLPVKENIITELDFTEATPLTKIFYIRGDDRAQAAADLVFKGVGSNNRRDTPFLNKIAQDAIRAGINAADPYSSSSEKSCGGKIFTKSTQY